jgi:penicillin-binding protein 1C
LELTHSKSSILSLYSAHAPFGGNVVGLPAASWRYFGRPPHDLSWAEAAVLAVLPNAPAAIHPGRNPGELLKKRNSLLERLRDRGLIDDMTFELASAEPLPRAPQPLPDKARHLLGRLHRPSAGENYHTTIDGALQERVYRLALQHQQTLASNRIFNAAVLVIHLPTREVVAYAGNTASVSDEGHSPEVDLIEAKRSTGSILKPFLYAALMDAGEILPGTLLPDIPSYFSGYSPRNFSLTYDGAVPANRALSRSLNIPAVYMLKQYGIQPFYELLKKLGMSTLSRPASHYGLSLILGGAEGTLWDISAMYMNLGRTPLAFASNYGDYHGVQEEWPLLVRGMESLRSGMESLPGTAYSAAAAWLTLKAMSDVNRPDEEEGWRSFASSRDIAWKTGTSFGFRDAWAIGLTPDYLVGVWAGNADGEGRPGLTGVSAASPLMFEVFRLLPPSSGWFPEPFDELERIAVCRQSGYRASPDCPETDSVEIYLAGLKSDPCPYHKIIHLDESESWRVSADCYPQHQIHSRPWFVLPPSWAWYYRENNPDYLTVPPWMPGCSGDDRQPMQFIYPAGDRKIAIPRDLDGKPQEIVFEAAHQVPSATIYWHLDGEYAGFTKDLHKMSLAPRPGRHTITLVDEFGNRLTTGIDVK